MSIELLYDIYSVEDILLSHTERVYFTTRYSDNAVCKEMVRVATMTDEDQLLSKMLRQKVDDVPKLLKKLHQFSVCCIADDGIEPFACNQGIAYSCGKSNF